MLSCTIKRQIKHVYFFIVQMGPNSGRRMTHGHIQGQGVPIGEGMIGSMLRQVQPVYHAARQRVIITIKIKLGHVKMPMCIYMLIVSFKIAPPILLIQLKPNIGL